MGGKENGTNGGEQQNACAPFVCAPFSLEVMCDRAAISVCVLGSLELFIMIDVVK